MKSMYHEYRCRCQKLLFKGILIDSQVEVKCRACKHVNVFTGQPASEYLCLKPSCANRVKLVD